VPALTREQARKQTAAERFKKPGSDKLWQALLGWPPERGARIWLAQAIHDAARTKSDADAAIGAFATHAPEAAKKLDQDAVKQAIDLWLASGDGYDAADPAPKWHYLATLAQKLALGTATPEELQDDWEAWISLPLAGPWHKALLTILAQAEQAAVGLGELTRSDRVAGVVNLTRAMWAALAYGDDASLELAKRAGDEWLATIAKQLPGSGKPAA
jgi:hypothetical protein